jgi:cytochrome c-type biogenesis protein
VFSISVPLVFVAGLLSFLSPCVLPLVPVYLSYLSGTGLGDEDRTTRWRPLAHGVCFVAGFTLVFVLLFGLPATLLGALLSRVSNWITAIGGLVLVLFGLHTMHVVRLPWLDRTVRFEAGARRSTPSYARSVLFGITFAAGWTPCIGPLLGTVMTLAFTEPARAMPYLLVYAAGLALPFLAAAAALTRALGWLSRAGRYAHAVEFVSGLLMVVIGLTLVTGTYTIVNNAMQRLVPQWLLRLT